MFYAGMCSVRFGYAGRTSGTRTFGGDGCRCVFRFCDGIFADQTRHTVDSGRNYCQHRTLHDQYCGDAQNTSSANAEYIAQLESQSAELAQYKQNEADFEAEKQKFYQEVVFSDSAPDIEEYKQYYESIDPADAEIIYRQVVEQTAANDEMDDYVKAYSSMKPKEAAAIFDTMTDNLQLVADILDSMDAQSRANILGKMDAATAAKVTAIMEPVE